ncbi:NADP-dependent phosphogluconate dehydrogenase [Candidatus Peregrinibacteria bacterium]|nr:NADP-dependent phosphogluconate dehydrogenase [Candidatus Peregrinibacteria bacterium]
MPPKYDIGVIGLAVMGANVSRNIARNGYKTIVYNRTPEKTREFLKNFGDEYLSGKENLHDFVAALEKPRKIILMIKAGEAVDFTISSILPFLEKDDILVDSGNSHFQGTIRRERELKAKKIHFFGVGVSGGEEGALKGPSIMPGGDKNAYIKHLAPIFEKIAARDFSGKPCTTYIGENGAGHYVKMVHNGIEYAVMQILAEVYDLLRKLSHFPASQIADVFAKLHQGKLESYLTEISVKILQKKDGDTSQYLLEKILDKAEQKGTGKWTVLDALDRGIALPTISEAVNARNISAQKELRVKLNTTYTSPSDSQNISYEELERILENAVSAAILSAYAQGYFLISEASREQNWNIDLAEISRIWQGGCILRAKVLQFLENAFRNAPEKYSHLFLFPEISEEIRESLPSLRKLVTIGAQGGVPLPCIMSALSYIENMCHARGSGNFLQGLRDFFGAHGFERIDREGKFHEKWGN